MSAAASDAARTVRTRRQKRRARYCIGRVGLYVGVAAVAVIIFFPIYWMFVSSIQPLKYALHFPPPLYPKAFNLDTYRAAAERTARRHLDLELDEARAHDHRGHDRAGDDRGLRDVAPALARQAAVRLHAPADADDARRGDRRAGLQALPRGAT